MAGLVLLAYALDHPHRLRRLVLIGTGSGGPAYMAAPGALWNRTHPGFRGLAVPGLLHMAWPRRATETMLNNYITRRSFADPRLASATRVLPGDWLRHRRGNPGMAPHRQEDGLQPAARRDQHPHASTVRPP
jgi:pimeloyl-ACP methyl ester carboxylesterase